MVPLFSTKQIRETDNYFINKAGIPGIVLMENAALSIYNFVIKEFPELNSFSKIGFLCGKGNNGGDGFAAARHFANKGFEAAVIHLSSEDEMSADCRTNYKIIKELSKTNKRIRIKKFSSLNDLNLIVDSDIIFDAMLGSGMEAGLREPYKSIVDNLNKINAHKAAVDIPTGLDADKGFAETVFNADLTITLGELKPGLFLGDGYSNCGKIVKGNIGIDNHFFDRFEVEDYLIEPEDAFSFLPFKDKSIHKYSAGKVVTIAGSAHLPGAAALTSKAALKIGAGASILKFPESAKNLVHPHLSEVIVESFNDNGSGVLSDKNIDELNDRLEWADVLAIGPGLGREKETQNAVLNIIEERRCRRIVIDADAIFALAENNYKNFNLSGLVFTPHHGEFSRLVGIKTDELQKDILKYGKQFVEKTSAYLVLKGAPTIIFSPDNLETFINTSGNPGMAKFGTGDVLTGVLSGLIAQSKKIEDSLIAGVYLHSLAADLLLKNYTEFGYTAEDIISELPSAIKFLRDSIV